MSPRGRGRGGCRHHHPPLHPKQKFLPPVVMMLQVLHVPQWGCRDETPPMSHSGEEIPMCVSLGCSVGLLFGGGGVGKRGGHHHHHFPPQKTSRCPLETVVMAQGPLWDPQVWVWGVFWGSWGGAVTTITPPHPRLQNQWVPLPSAVGSPMSHSGAAGMRILGLFGG